MILLCMCVVAGSGLGGVKVRSTENATNKWIEYKVLIALFVAYEEVKHKTEEQINKAKRKDHRQTGESWPRATRERLRTW